MNPASSLVSILMPVKNAAAFLNECIDSIINQSWSSWELIAVHDHSYDDSLKILHQYDGQDPRIKVLENKGHGIIPALQLAFQQSKGTYITRMDADDIMAEDKVELMVRALWEKGENSLAVGHVEYFSHSELGDGYKKYASWLNGLTQSGSNFSEIYKECTIPSPCWMTSRSDLVRCGGFFSEIYPEDYDLAFRFKKAGLSIAPVNKTVHKWRDHPDRASRNDPNYKDNGFIQVKIQHFLEQELSPKSKLVIWGAGRKGKQVARSLLKREVPFTWMTDNLKKIGRKIYGILLRSSNEMCSIEPSQVIVAIAAIESLALIDKTIEENEQHAFYRFC